MRLRVRVYYKGSPLATIDTGLPITEGKWDSKAQCVIKGSTHGEQKASAYAINAQISRLRDKMVTYMEETEKPSKNGLLRSIGRDVPQETEESSSEGDIFEAFTAFIDLESRRREWTKATLTKVNSLKRHLLRFRSDLTFAQLTEDTLLDFVTYLQSPYAMQMTYNLERGLRNSSVSKTIDHLKWFLRWCAAHGYYNGNIHETFAPKLKGSRNKEALIYLTKDELMKLHEAKFEQREYNLTQDYFLLECFTALRFSDVQALTWGNVSEDMSSITTVAKKTAKRITIPLNAYARAILEKYAQGERQGRVLPYLTNQRCNIYLKECCRIAGIDAPISQTYYIGNERHDVSRQKWECITTHAGRRTFVVNALTMGASPYVVKELGGWSSMNAMQPYTNIIDDAKAQVTALFDTWK